ncbi:MAG TPA: helix-turn-helix domain-containing protein [Candidatus Dormibacteraeota bacterium]|nr:helix-turn-helix domain-containing protein [Candidatus Dormibacteraeota bacterium]
MPAKSNNQSSNFADGKRCPVGRDLSALGKRWTFHILNCIGISQIDRFNRILRSIPGLTPRVLIMRLNELETCGFIEPVTLREKPRLVKWALTDKGRDTLPILHGYSNYLAKWYPNASLENHTIRLRPKILELIETAYKKNHPEPQIVPTKMAPFLRRDRVLISDQ